MSMQIYKVGGCVRDRLLREQGVNAPTGDIDWVVTGATPEAMLARGFMPVGADFPVFLHLAQMLVVEDDIILYQCILKLTLAVQQMFVLGVIYPVSAPEIMTLGDIAC